MEQKLTAQIATMYPNAQLKCKHGLCKIKSIDFENNSAWVIADEGFFEAPVQLAPCKLELRSLSEITDEDAMIVATIVNMNKRDIVKYVGRTADTVTVGKYIISEIINHGYFEFVLRPQTYNRLFTTLRQLGYDCDNLIQSGIAIQK